MFRFESSILNWRAPDPRLQTKAVVALKSQILINVENRVPYDGGDTYRSSVQSYSTELPYIEYDTDYAEYIYENKRNVSFQTAHHTNAQDRWHDDDWVENEPEYIKLVGDVLEEGLI